MRLSETALDYLPEGVARPGYARERVTPGIVHLGIGAFHRAHLAAYVDRLLASDPSWGIVGASLRSPETADALNPQNGLYTLCERTDRETAPAVIGSVLRVLVLPEDRAELLDLMSLEAVRIVSLTVTEKGYCHDPATGTLDETNGAVRADLADPSRPATAPGLLVEALARRRALGLPAFTILSCDNLPANGRTVRRIVTRFAELCDPDLARWIAQEVAFPSSMVDRIVPATTDADRALVAERLGVEDAWPVMTEPFTQWVVEDRFPAGRPAFETVGVEMVADVEPYELMKLRMLNGAHSAIAYLGYLAGRETVADVMAETAFARFVHALMTEEVMATLDVPGADLPAYRDALIARFRNRGLRHRTSQIAMDGSQKIPQRWLGTIRADLAAGRPFPCLALGLAAWMTYVGGIDEAGAPIDVRDPMAARLRAACEDSGTDPARRVAALTAITDIFGTDLPADGRFVGAVERALIGLWTMGAADAVKRLAPDQAIA